MARVFNDLVFLVGPWMLGDQFFFIIEGDPLIIGFKSEHAGGIDKWDTVAIGFEADQILRTTFDSLGQTGIVIDLGERDEEGFFLLEEEVHGFFAGSPMDSAIGDLVSPKQGLMVQIGQGGEGSS